MPIFDQGYQHWNGQLSGHTWRWWTITRHGVRTVFKGKLVRMLILLAWAPALALAALLILWGLFEQKSSLIVPFLGLFQGLPDEVKAGPQHYRTVVWTLAYYFFFEIEVIFSMLLVLLVGPGLISQDLRFNAMPLYFARPLRRSDYFLGKLGVIGVFLAAVAIVPAVIAWLLGICFSLDFSVIKDTLPILLGGMLYGLVVVTSAGTLMLAISSLSRNSRYVGAMWVGLWVISSISAGVLTGLMTVEQVHAQRARMHEEVMARQMGHRAPARAEPPPEERPLIWYPILSYTNNLQRLCIHFLDTDSAWGQFFKFVPNPRERAELTRTFTPGFPWYWSAGVLAGLWGISVWILTMRVKSLDRLR